MTVSDEHERDWGERRLAGRKRRAQAIQAAILVAALGFGLFAPRLVSASGGGNVLKLVLAVIYTAAVLFGSWALWRQTDEVERHRAINSLAAIGLASMVLSVLVMIAVPIFAIKAPLTTVLTVSLAIGAIVYVVQKVRG